MDKSQIFRKHKERERCNGHGQCQRCDRKVVGSTVTGIEEEKRRDKTGKDREEVRTV